MNRGRRSAGISPLPSWMPVYRVGSIMCAMPIHGACAGISSIRTPSNYARSRSHHARQNGFIAGARSPHPKSFSPGRRTFSPLPAQRLGEGSGVRAKNPKIDSADAERREGGFAAERQRFRVQSNRVQRALIGQTANRKPLPLRLKYGPRLSRYDAAASS